MKNTFSLEELSKTSNLDAILISRHYKLDILAKFMEIKSANSRLRQEQIAKEIGCSRSTSQRYRNDINKLPPYRIPPYNSNKRKQRFQIQTSMTIHIASVTLKDL